MSHPHDERPDPTAGKGSTVGHRWELLVCAATGHLTYRPEDAPAMAERLHVDAPQGEGWRCLRCGTFVLGAPHASGPEADAPVPRRGNELRDSIIMRFLALERGFRALLLFALAAGIWRFAGAQDTVEKTFDAYLPAVRGVTDKMGIDLYDSSPVRMAEKVFAYQHHTLMLAVMAVAAYGAVEMLEAVGLWVMKRWGEYVAVVGTSAFLPFELYDLVEKVTVLRVGTLLVNLAAVVWLVWSKRLFGARGGAAAYEEERRGASILQLEHAALDA